MSSCHGPAGGAPAAGIRGGVSAGRIPRGTPPNLPLRGEVLTKAQELRPISNCNTLLNHVLPLARFVVSPVYVAAAWCGPTTIMLAREVEALNNAIRRPTAHLLVGGC
jgi:hypothetical protein